MLWPPMRKALADDSDGAALLDDAMEAEHSAIDPLLAASPASWATATGRSCCRMPAPFKTRS
jgi:hypothetical protein